MNFPIVGNMKYQCFYEEVINISKVILGHIIILRHLLGKHELPYNNDQVEFLCRRLKEILISLMAFE